MTRTEFATRIVLLALGWVLVIARAVAVGFDAGTLWSTGGVLAISLALALVRFMPGPPPTSKPPDPETLSKGERLAASTPGKVVTILSVAVLAIGMGSIAGLLVCLPVLGPRQTVTALPGVLGRAALAATLSAVGFVILVVVIALLGTRILSGVFEHWAAYIAPVIGGVIGAVLESGAFATGLLVVGLSAVVGGIASIIYEGIQSNRLTVKSLGETSTAGLGIGAINGLVLALTLGVLGMLR
jgi:hypothetical protein